MQEIAVYIIIAISLVYGASRIYKSMKNTNDPCNGCDGCALKNLKKKGHCDFKQKRTNKNTPKT
ncbi:FeoB-associated Cys-rich membrane protein [Xylanibacter muris]|uniref:FeoB-associated Cys-rich membrane protein n=1 Tax=Xylanibacter muris TaxID=2736290 RepID=UPI0025A12A9E|nr:FeoB-associated Cys-rich membrane protein [Xylanibacter muris]